MGSNSVTSPRPHSSLRFFFPGIHVHTRARDRSCHTVNSISSTNYHFQAVDSAAVHLKHQASPLEQVQATWRAVRAQSRRSMIDCATGQRTEALERASFILLQTSSQRRIHTLIPLATSVNVFKRPQAAIIPLPPSLTRGLRKLHSTDLYSRSERLRVFINPRARR